MKRQLTALVLAGSLATAAMATPTPAHARWGWGWGLGAFALGAFLGAALARPAYAYYPAYSYGYAYPAYSYGYAYPPIRTAMPTPPIRMAMAATMAVTGLTTVVLPCMEAIGSLAALRFIALAGAEAACGLSSQAGATGTRSKRSGELPADVTRRRGTNGGNAARNEYR